MSQTWARSATFLCAPSIPGLLQSFFSPALVESLLCNLLFKRPTVNFCLHLLRQFFPPKQFEVPEWKTCRRRRCFCSYHVSGIDVLLVSMLRLPRTEVETLVKNLYLWFLLMVRSFGLHAISKRLMTKNNFYAYLHPSSCVMGGH